MPREPGSGARSIRAAAVALVGAALVMTVVTAGCSTNDASSTPSLTASSPAPDATASPSASPTTPATPASRSASPTAHAATSTTPPGPAAPTAVMLKGRLPDTAATVTPGEGESGRVTVVWAYDGAVDGFRLYRRDCDGTVTGEPIEVGATERQFGPLQPCRPGGQIGVVAYDTSGESETVWAVPGEAR